MMLNRILGKNRKRAAQIGKRYNIFKGIKSVQPSESGLVRFVKPNNSRQGVLIHYIVITLSLLLFFFSCSEDSPMMEMEKPDPSQQPFRVAGFRASRILSSYPDNQFPNPQYWTRVGNEMAFRYSDATPGGVWIVSLYQSGGETRLNFPVFDANYPFISDINVDQNEAYLDYFDQNGVKVWLQVESGAASIDTLIDLVLGQYGYHPSVIGFGIDVEWYQQQDFREGKPVSDAEAEAWEDKVKSIDSTYTLFLKHYNLNWMPPNYRGDIVFVDDSQNFNSFSQPYQALINEYRNWGNHFYPNPVAFQIGYPNDQNWWSLLSDPPGEMGNALFDAMSNCYGMFWVDFTVDDVFPVNGKR